MPVEGCVDGQLNTLMMIPVLYTGMAVGAQVGTRDYLVPVLGYGNKHKTCTGSEIIPRP
jgi:hypothetical protein